MEEEPKKPESANDDDSDDENDSSQTKSSKKSNLNSKKAAFFKTEEPETDSETLDSEETEGLNEEEVHEAVLAIVDTRMQDVSEELNAVESDSAEEFAAMSSAIFLESLADRANSDEDFSDAEIEAAYLEAMEDIALDDEEETAESETGSSSGPPSPPEPPDSLDDSEGRPEEDGPAAIPLAGIPAVPTERENMTTATSVEAPDEYEAYIPRSDMLLGVVVGYIVGRRGGRIRTEKKLKPEIKKLENQVAELCNVVVEKEKLIRKQSQKIYEQSFDKPDKTQAVIERRKVRAQVNEQLKRREELLNDPGVEKIGKFSLPALKVFHEKRLPDGSENSPSRKSVEIMTVNELLEKVSNLEIDGIRVSQMFHNNRLSEKALRQITKEYLRGGEYKKTFYRELGPDLEHLESKRQELDKIRETKSVAVQEPFDNSVSIANTKNIEIDKQKPNQEHFQQIQNEKKVIKWTVFVGAAIAILIIYLLLS